VNPNFLIGDQFFW